MTETQKLFKVHTKAVKGTYYVIAKNPTEAYDKVKEKLDSKDWGFKKDREFESAELIAEAIDYPDCGTILLV